MKQDRKKGFGIYKAILKVFIKKPKYIMLGDDFVDVALYLSNHAGAKGPLKHELYFPKKMRLWGTYEMNGTLKERHHYLCVTYFHNKKHFPIWLSYIIGTIATPFLTLFYKGVRLISTYPDGRMISTIKKSLKVVIEDKQSIIIFPEDSSKGYFDFIKAFHPGFYSLAYNLYKKGIDIPIYLMYYQRLTNRVIVDKPIMFSSLKDLNLSMQEVSEKFRLRSHHLATLNDEEINKEKNKKHFML